MSNEKRYWHELTEEEQQAVMKRNNYTIADFVKEFCQPDWCRYPGALRGMMGCVSLVDGYVRDSSYCKACEYFNAQSPANVGEKESEK